MFTHQSPQLTLFYLFVSGSIWSEQKDIPCTIPCWKKKKKRETWGILLEEVFTSCYVLPLIILFFSLRRTSMKMFFLPLFFSFTLFLFLLNNNKLSTRKEEGRLRHRPLYIFKISTQKIVFWRVSPPPLPAIGTTTRKKLLLMNQYEEAIRRERCISWHQALRHSFFFFLFSWTSCCEWLQLKKQKRPAV